MIHLDELSNQLRPKEVAEILRISVHTLKRWTTQGKIIVTRVGKRKDRIYLKKDIIEFINTKAEDQVR